MRPRRWTLTSRGDFVATAAQLVYIKSKMLLPRHEEDEEDDPVPDWVEMLLEYQRLKEITPYFRENGSSGDIFVKPPENLGSAERIPPVGQRSGSGG